MSDINSRIAAVIQAAGMTKTAFAEKLNVSQSFISRLAAGVSTPSDRTITDICREFGVSEQWLRTGEGEMFLRLSREEEISRFCMSIIRDPDSVFQRQLVSVLARLEPAQWQLLADMAAALCDAQKKDAE